MFEAIFGKYLGIAKLVAVGAVLVTIGGLIIWAVVTVDGWRHDSQALPSVIAERDVAIAEKAELEKYTVGAFTHIETGIDALGAKWANFETNYSGSMASIDAAVASFERNTAHVEACPAPGSPGDLLLRNGLLQLLANPDTGAISRSGGGADQGGEKAAMPGAAAPAQDVPGRKAGHPDQQGLVVPGAGLARHGRQRRAAEGRGGRSDRLGAKGTGRKAAAGRVGSAVSHPATFAGLLLKTRRIGKRTITVSYSGGARG